MPSIFQNFVTAVSKQFQNNNKNVPVSTQGFRGPYFMDMGFGAGFQDGLYKAVIPEFLYKPPFGYPLSKDIPEIRRLSKAAYVSMIINTITNEIAGLDWKITPEKGEKIPEEIINKTKHFFYNPNSNDESFDFVIRKLVRDILEIDAGVIVKVWSLKGELLEFYVYDGATFTKNCNIHGVLPEETAFFQYGWATGSRPTPFDRKEIVYIMMNPRADSIYGRSAVENLFDILRMLTYGIESNLEYFTDNNVPRGVFQMVGANQADVKAFQDSWQEMLRRKDAGGNWKKYFQKMPVTNADGQFVRIGFSNIELEMIEQQKWFSKIAFASFGVTPDELGFTEDSNKAVTIGQSAVFKRKAIRPLVQLLEYHFSTQLINDLPWIKGKYENKVLFEFDKFDLAEELSRRQLIWGDISSGYRSINEIREENNLKPLETNIETTKNALASFNADGEQLDKGTAIESKEHPEFSEEQVKQIAADHLKEDKNYYADEANPSDKKNNPESKKKNTDTESKALTSESPVDPKSFERIKKSEKEIDDEIEKLKKDLLLAIDAADEKVELKALGKEFIDEILSLFSFKRIVDRVDELLTDSFFDGNDKVEKEVNRNLLPNSDTLNFLKKYTFENVKGLEDEAKNKLRQELQRAVMNNTPREELAGKIKDLIDVSASRAKAIANTEIMRARNIGELNAWKETGLKMKKKVLARIDERTSEICRHLNGTSVDLDDNFEYKGESFVGPPFHPNCRSVLTYEVAKK